jgi:hypothetical protein
VDVVAEVHERAAWAASSVLVVLVVNFVDVVVLVVFVRVVVVVTDLVTVVVVGKFHAPQSPLSKPQAAVLQKESQ